jgi:hypothetical protein
MPQKLPGTPQPSLPDDGTTGLLFGGTLILAIGLVAVLALMTVFGGVGVEGAHNNPGWLALIVGAMCLPFGLLLELLGIAKWFRRRGLKRDLKRGLERDLMRDQNRNSQGKR